MESKVLSGGIENRFLSQFDQDTKDKLQSIFEISQDTQSLELLTQPVHLNEEDKLLSTILARGLREDVDLFIDVLQSAFEHPSMRATYARVGAENGLQMSRVVFAVMIKYSQLTDELEQQITEVQLLDEQQDLEMERPQRIKAIVNEVKQDEDFKKLLHQWS